MLVFEILIMSNFVRIVHYKVHHAKENTTSQITRKPLCTQLYYTQSSRSALHVCHSDYVGHHFL